MSDVRGVLDANLLASGLVSPNGPGNALIAEARLGRFELVVSSHLLADVREALMEAFHVDDQGAGELLAFVERSSERVTVGAYLVCGVLCCFLPNVALPEEEVIEAG